MHTQKKYFSRIKKYVVKEIAIKSIKTQICECLCQIVLWNIIYTMFSIVIKFHKEVCSLAY
jgi:hypothetical protein